MFQTHIDGYCWTSEKTCLPFVYGHPFLLFAMANTWQYLKLLGYTEYTQSVHMTALQHLTHVLRLYVTQYIQEESMRKETLDAILQY